jgi:acyl-CoA thioester hydrolase
MTFPTPFAEFEGCVRPEWIDANDHMNLAYYVVLFDQATDAIFAALGIGFGQRGDNHGTFAAEAHTLHMGELRLGERVLVETWVIGLDTRRLHLAHEMRRAADGSLAAAQELLFLHVDLGRRKVRPWLADAWPRLQAAAAAHAGATRPAWVGRAISMAARPFSAPPTPARGTR